MFMFVAAVADGLRLRGVDVLTAQEDETTELQDPQLLNRATQLGRVFFTQDKGFCVRQPAASDPGRS